MASLERDPPTVPELPDQERLIRSWRPSQEAVAALCLRRLFLFGQQLAQLRARRCRACRGCAAAVGWMRSAWNSDTRVGRVGDALEQEGHERGAFVAPATLANTASKRSRVVAAVVRRHLDADDQHLARRRPARRWSSAAGCSRCPPAAGRAARRWRRARSRPGSGLCCASRAGRRARPPERGVAADAGVDHGGRDLLRAPAAFRAAAPSLRRA